jgi:hypothetical protein
MVIDYNNIYLNIEKPPSRKYILVAIPMYLYRVETNEFSHGLNFFQKIVLKFKSKAGIRDEGIAKYIGLDTKLISIVSNELRTKKLINDFGALTDKGKEKLFEVDGLVIDSTKKKIGYVLQYLNQDKLYPFYVKKIIPADTTTENNAHPKIITGTKGDGNDYTDIPFYLDELYKSRNNQPKPFERDVLNLIQNTNKKGIQINNESDIKIESLSNQLSIRFINEHPDIIWVSTYIYLHQREDETYAPDWRVLDPYGFADNVGLKFYLNNPINKNLLESIAKRFSDTKIIGGKILVDYQNELNKIIEEKIDDYFIGYHQLDNNLQEYIRSIEKNYFIQTSFNYSDLDASVSFSLNLQTTLENILKHDKEKHGEYYQRVYQEFGDDLKKRKGLINIWRQRLFSNNTQVPRQILNASKGNLKYGKSLLAYLVSFILTYNFDNKSVLFKVLINRIDLIVEIAQLRNEKGHGQTSVEKSLKPLSKEEAEKYYQFIKSLINEYIQNQ